MSTRSNAWYAENLELRQANMRAYANALTLLGQHHVDERTRDYKMFVGQGLGANKARYSALAAIRDRHRAEFRKILEDLRKAGSDA